MDPPRMQVTQEEMAANNVPLHVRDYCAHVLIPLNKCRREKMFVPWGCPDEMHSYEICMFKEYERRRQIKKESK